MITKYRDVALCVVADPSAFPGISNMIYSIESTSSYNCLQRMLVYLLTTSKSHLRVTWYLHTLKLRFLKVHVRSIRAQNVPYIKTRSLHASSVYNSMRFLIPAMMPDWTNVVFLDSDVRVCRSLCDLYDTISGMQEGVAAVPVNSSLEFRRNILTLKEKMYEGGEHWRKFPELWHLTNVTRHHTFNSGVMGLNLDYWRRHGVLRTLVRLIREHATDNLWDQRLATNPPLVIYFSGRFKHLDPRWNVHWLGYREMKQRATKVSYILHWAGPKKPWHADGLNKILWCARNCYVDHIQLQ